ncbi:MAG: hypothetical protein L6Q49_22605, partial [Anaerolineales bacterium]|nr:hypothetical protein [Anaerolineales bacterium]
ILNPTPNMGNRYTPQPTSPFPFGKGGGIGQPTCRSITIIWVMSHHLKPSSTQSPTWTTATTLTPV